MPAAIERGEVAGHRGIDGEIPLTAHPRARGGGCRDGAGGAVRARGLCATAAGFNNCVEGTLYPLLTPTCAAAKDIGGWAAGGDSRFSEMMKLRRWGDERQRQVRGVGFRSPGVAHAAEVT